MHCSALLLNGFVNCIPRISFTFVTVTTLTMSMLFMPLERRGNEFDEIFLFLFSEC